jgi:hypothetical protein
METLENCGPLSDPMLGSGSVSPNFLISSHNGYFGPTTTLAAFNHPQFHHQTLLDDNRYDNDLNCNTNGILISQQQCGLVIDHSHPVISDAYTSNNGYVNINIKYEYDDGMHKVLTPCLSPQLPTAIDDSAQQIQVL